MAADHDSRADWDHWRNVGKCELWQAVVLTMNFDPRCFQVSAMGRLIQHGGDPVGPGDSKTIEDRIAVAISNLEDGIPDHSPQFWRKGPRQATVVLSEFGEWAPLDWDLPDQFPGRRKAVIAEPSTGGITIHLPHTTQALDALFAVIRKYWTNYDPANLPKQETVAADIDKAIGGKPDKDGAPSRNARALAALIKPDTVAAVDKRGRKR